MTITTESPKTFFIKTERCSDTKKSYQNDEMISARSEIEFYV